MPVKKDIDGGTPFDWGRSALAYAEFRDIYPPEFYDAICALGFAAPGQHVLDLGTGTGVLPRHLYEGGASFVGVDVALPQIVQARRMSKPAGKTISYVVAPAEELPFAEDSFDAAMACQCLQYFDLPRFLPRLKSVLKPGGLFGIFFLAWLPDESEIAARSEKLVLRHSPNWNAYGWQRWPVQMPDWAGEYGFTQAGKSAFMVPLPFTRESWNGRMVACRGIGPKLSPGEVTRFEAEHLNMLRQTAPESFEIPHWATLLALRNEK